MEIGYISFGENRYILEEAKFSSWLTGGELFWTFEIYPPGEENYIMLNNMEFFECKFPTELDGINVNLNGETDDLYEHTVYVQESPSNMISLNLKMEKWDSNIQTIEVSGNGLVQIDEHNETVSFEFKAVCEWDGMEVISSDEEKAVNIVTDFWGIKKEKINFKFEDAADGVTCNAKLK